MLYEFDILYRGEVFASYSVTPLTNETPARCCPCYYDTRIIEETVDWAEMSK